MSKYFNDRIFCLTKFKMITPDDGSRNHCRNVAYALTAPNTKTMEKVQKVTPEKLKNPSYQTFREQLKVICYFFCIK